MFITRAIFVGSLVVSCPAVRAEFACDGVPVRTLAADAAVEERVCAIAEQAAQQLARCGLPLTREVTIRVVDEGLGDGCVGLYHCGQDLIEILSPQRLEVQRKEQSLFSNLATQRFFDSVVVHELAHAAHDALPCPSGVCLATSEYLAYNHQIMSLSSVDREAVMASIDMDRIVQHDEVNASILFFKPDTFAARAWAHLNQREDACDYLRHIARGDFTFDRERP
ncbi:DUF6639 family protein [Alloyangia pacifica]|uniref:DUF6639 family protein n=1 Tax=Alloyangia pacifica TaxID=311180 RepID=UPI001CD2DE35|nr:DUF6639 family protein [Alloyangia pacifica]MCA0996076.1 hypothetical protein [Alloyangia pacifica]